MQVVMNKCFLLNPEKKKAFGLVSSFFGIKVKLGDAIFGIKVCVFAFFTF